MIQQGGAAGAMAGLRTTYATTAAPKGWAGHRLEMRNGVGPFIAMAPAPAVAGASIFEGVWSNRGSTGFADKVLDDLTLRSKMASSPILGGAVPPLEWISEEVFNAFVEEFERAHQYFLFKEHVREVCDDYVKDFIWRFGKNDRGIHMNIGTLSFI